MVKVNADVMSDYVKRILASRVYDVAVETPLQLAPRLSARLNNQVLLKREDLQPVFSFKLRGAYNKVAHLTREEQAKGVVTASAGNHAQGLAMAAQHLGLHATIVMPETTPRIKVNAAKSRGAHVVLIGDTFNEAYQYSTQLVQSEGAVYVHPYDDEYTIAGQGTIGMEILRQYSGRLDAVFVPVGGGGLIAGVAVFIKYLMPDIKIVGVEAEDSACLLAALEANQRVVLPEVGLFPDGIAVSQIGEKTFALAQSLVDEVITVSIDEICSAIKYGFEDTRVIAEPAGAAAIAGVKKYVEQTGAEAQALAVILSGANVNFDRLKHIVERSETGETAEALLAVRIKEEPGSFLRFCRLLSGRNITEFNYRYSGPSDAEVFVGVTLMNGDGVLDREVALPKVIGVLQQHGYQITDLSDNDMAKMHVRHMVGGRARQVNNERLYRFQFPERPGALLRFLENLGQFCNISLFHYRNNGAAYGRVLVGLQVMPSDEKEVFRRLKDIGYPYWEETENPAYQKFLR